MKLEDMQPRHKIWKQLRSRSGTPADLDVGAVIALHALDVLLCHLCGKVWVFSVGLRAATPSRIPIDIDVWSKCIEAPADKGTQVLPAVLMPDLQFAQCYVLCRGSQLKPLWRCSWTATKMEGGCQPRPQAGRGQQ